MEPLRARLHGLEGLAFRGAFHPTPQDHVPASAGGAPILTLALLGWTGADQWPVFAASPEFADGLPDPLDRWARRLIDGLAAELGATAFYPFGGPPLLNFLSWARKAEPVHRSPLGLLIHPQWGLWHSYRGAIGFASACLSIPGRTPRIPASNARIVPAFRRVPSRLFSENYPYDVAACRQHVKTAGEDCRTRACAARRACPVAPDKRYGEPQAAFHMRALLAGRYG